jgi:DNA-binding GntR family transcriptional regulator
LSKQQAFSITTVYKAYSELEVMGWIEARTKSGYYVKQPPRQSYAWQRNLEELTDMERLAQMKWPPKSYKNLAEENIFS